MSTTPAPANRKPTGGGAGAAIASAVRRPGCVTVAKETVIACGTLSAFVGTIGVLGVSTTPPTGGSTVIADAALPMLPLASRERKTTFVVPTGNSVLAVASITVAFTLACGTRRTGAASRRSTAVPPARNAPTRCDTAEAGTLPRAPLISVAATVMAAGGVTDGANVSTTITLNDAVRVFPCVSLAVQATVVAPSGNVDPLADVQVATTLPSTASTADAVYANAAPVGPVASIVAFAGTVMTGAVVSLTVAVNALVPAFPWLWVAVHVTVVAPSGNVDPETGVHATATLPSPASTAEAVYVNTAPVAPVASTLAFGGTVMTGGVVSGAFSIVTSIVAAVDALSAASNARAVNVTGPLGRAAVFQLTM